jgi:hypothetical protein
MRQPYGVTGTTSWRVDGKDIDVGPGEPVFIKHGIVQGFTNRTTEGTMSRPLGGVDTYLIHKMMAARVTTAR